MERTSILDIFYSQYNVTSGTDREKDTNLSFIFKIVVYINEIIQYMFIYLCKRIHSYRDTKEREKRKERREREKREREKRAHV